MIQPCGFACEAGFSSNTIEDGCGVDFVLVLRAGERCAASLPFLYGSSNVFFSRIRASDRLISDLIFVTDVRIFQRNKGVFLAFDKSLFSRLRYSFRLTTTMNASEGFACLKYK